MIRQRAASGVLPSVPGSSGVIVVVTDTTVVVVVIVPVREILQLGSMVEEEEPPPPPVTVEEALEGEAPDTDESAPYEVARPDRGETRDGVQEGSAQEEDPRRQKLPKALRDIADYNAKGAEEGDCLKSSRLRARHK